MVCIAIKKEVTHQSVVLGENTDSSTVGAVVEFLAFQFSKKFWNGIELDQRKCLSTGGALWETNNITHMQRDPFGIHDQGLVVL